MDENFNQMGTGPAPRFHLPHHIPPSSPPASPPRQRQHQHSNSISESLSDNTRLQTIIDKSQLLEYSVLRAYPPANASRRRVTPPQPRLVVPPSPPESFIASGTRQYRSGSSATVKTMPRQDEEPDPVPIISSLKGKFNKALTMRRGNHSRQSSDVDNSPRELDAGKNLTPTTLQTQSPHSAPNSANTVNLSAVSTAHTSLYSHTFPIPDTLLEERGKESSTDNSSSYALPTYYNGGTASRSPNQQLYERSDYGRHNASKQSSEDHHNFEVRGGEVRIEIRKPNGKENRQDSQSTAEILFRDVYQERGRGNKPSEGPSSRNVARGIHYIGRDMEAAKYDDVEGQKKEEEGNKDATINLRHHRAYPNLRDRTDLPARELSYGSVGNESKNSDDLADETAQYFEDLGFGDSPAKSYKKAIADQQDLQHPGSDGKEVGSSSAADHSSSLLGDSSLFSLNMGKNYSSDKLSHSQRPGTLGRNHTSSSSNVLRSPRGGAPNPGRLLTGQASPCAERPSSMDPNDAAEIVRCLSGDVGKRLSVLSSPGGSIMSNSGLGAGFAVVVTADGLGEINNMSGHLISISGEDADADSTSDGEGNSSLGKRDKGKGKAVSEEGGRSTGESNESSKNGIASSLGNSVQDGSLEGKAEVSGENVRVHLGDERYDFVYRVRSASPDNQPLLVPFYKSPPQSSFPYRNALNSSMPQKSVSQQRKDTQTMAERATPPQKRSDRPMVYSGETPPSLVEKAFVRPAAGAPYARPQLEDLNGHRKRLKKFGKTKEEDAKEESSTKHTALTAPGDGPADTLVSTTTSGSDFDLSSTSYAVKSQGNEEESSDVVSNSGDTGSFSAGNFDYGGPSAVENEISEYPSSPPDLSFAYADRVRESHGSDPGSVYSDNPSEPNSRSFEHRDSSPQSLRLEPTESVTQVLEDYRRSLYSSEFSNQDFWRTSVIQNESAVTQGPERGDARSRVAPSARAIAPDQYISHSHPRRASIESAPKLASRLSRLRSIDVFDENDPGMNEGRRNFDTAPYLVKKYYIVQPKEGIVPGQPEAPAAHSRDPEYIALQKKYSRVLLSLCSLFPPMLIILAYGGMDEMMLNFTDGKVDNVGIFYKRVAFFMGTFIGSACCCVPIVVGILAALGAL